MFDRTMPQRKPTTADSYLRRWYDRLMRPGYAPSVLDRIRAASSRAAAQKIADGIDGVSSGTRRKWALAIASKAALLLLALSLSGCASFPFCGWLGPSCPRSDCRKEGCSRQGETCEDRSSTREYEIWECGLPTPPKEAK